MSFDRHDSHKKKSVPSSWRKPVGTHSRSRLKRKDAPPMPDPGYRSPKETRGRHPSGYREVLVERPADLEELDTEEEAARVASAVGAKKREMIAEKAEELGVELLNIDIEEVTGSD